MVSSSLPKLWPIPAQGGSVFYFYILLKSPLNATCCICCVFIFVFHFDLRAPCCICICARAEACPSVPRTSIVLSMHWSQLQLFFAMATRCIYRICICVCFCIFCALYGTDWIKTLFYLVLLCSWSCIYFVLEIFIAFLYLHILYMYLLNWCNASLVLFSL